MTTSKSSKRWLHEHAHDPYVQQAKAMGYRSRAVFKLLEIQEKDRVLRPGMMVVDLGAAPGGWSQVAAKLVGAKGKVFALDILPMEPILGVEFLQGDFLEPSVYSQLMDALGGKPVDVVLSDIAPNMTGTSAIDQPRAMAMAESALYFAEQVLTNNGVLLVKVFQGEGFDPYLASLRKAFRKVKVRKPKASRARSREVYVIGLGRRPIKS